MVEWYSVHPYDSAARTLQTRRRPSSGCAACTSRRVGDTRAIWMPLAIAIDRGMHNSSFPFEIIYQRPAGGLLLASYP